MADALLRARALAPQLRTNTVPLGMVGTSRLAEGMTERLVEYVRRFGDGQAFGLVDRAGRLLIRGCGDGELVDEPPRRASDRSALTAKANAANPFTDLGECVLKALLAPRLPEKLIGCTRHLGDGVRAMAAAVRVSPPTVSRILAGLRREELFDDAERTLVRVRHLLERWRSVAMARAVSELPMRWLLRPADSDPELDRCLRALVASPDAPRTCVGLFAACDRLGVGVVRGTTAHVLFGVPLEQAARRLRPFGLVPSRPGQPADVVLRRTPTPESVFGAHVLVGGVPVADIVQCWLDVSGHPARGREQADVIWRRVLARHLPVEDPT